MHILQLVSVRWWNASAYYGISLTDALNQTGVRSTAGGGKSSPPILKAPSFNIPVFTDIELESLNPLQLARNVSRLNHFVRDEGVSIINAHRPEDSFFGAIIKRMSSDRIPLVRTVSDVRSPKENRLNRWLHQHGLDHVIFSCRANYERYQAAWPIFEKKSTVIYSAIDTERFKPMPREQSLRDELGITNEIVVGIIARLSPVKDHRTFIRAAARVAEVSDKVRFLISGEAAQISHEELRSFAAECGVEKKCHFLKRDFKKDVRELLNTVDIGVVTSNDSEVICRVSVEYMALAKPQVVTDTNVLPEIVDDGRNGFVIPAGDDKKLAERILQLSENDALRSEMGACARRYAVDKFSYPVFAAQTLAVYRDLSRNFA